MNYDLQNSSRIPGFYDLSLKERADIVSMFSQLEASETKNVANFESLDKSLTNTFIENAIGTFSLPLGIATNFRINNQDYLIPMAVEETSVIAAASYGAKMCRKNGGFVTTSSQAIMTGQIQIFIDKNENYTKILKEKTSMLLEYVNQGHDRLISRGGGAKKLSWYYIDELSCLVLMLDISTCDAMGANIVNTMCEKAATLIPSFFTKCRVGLKILTNLTSKRIATATCTIPSSVFSSDIKKAHRIMQKIVDAWKFAWYDIYRATTHNKGIMNGIDPILIATGNDWRAIEAGVHAYAARSGKYRPLSSWSINQDDHLVGHIELPMAVGVVGGVTKLHPTSQVALKILAYPNARKLAEICCAVGLAQNLSAIKALATEGIQRSHMGLHKKNIDLLAKTTHANVAHIQEALKV